MSDHLSLADEIFEFLDKHANRSPNYDPAYDEPGDAFTGPDPAMMYNAAVCLRNGEDFRMPWSEWGSGCYAPLRDKEAEEWHDRLLARVREHLAGRNAPTGRP